MYKSTEPGSSTARPNLARQDTELLASYYQSPLADQGVNYSPHALDTRPTRPAHRRTLSGDSTSSSDYSSSGSTSDHSIEEAKPATRRASVPSEGGADRRRLAIVQMDPVREAESPTASSPSAVRSRRGFETRLEGLALVAPPDAAGNLHQYINPPGSAPPTGSRSNPHPQPDPEDKGHNRSASEVTSRSLKTKSSRDVGIVGTASSSTSSSAPLQSPKMKLSVQIATESLLPPVFQEPHSSRASTPNTRASTPNSSATPSDARSLAPKRRSTDMSVHTPEIGQSKEIHVPVASPVVVDLGPAASLRVGHSTFDRRSPALQVVEPRPASPLPLSSYLHYQPGLHATAGPLPPPPRATFSIDPLTPPPPRPPRLHSPPPRSPRRADLDAVNQPLQLAVSAVLSGSSGSSTPSSTSRSISPPRAADRVNSEESNDETLHRREGAFSPSVISTTPSTSPSDYSPTTARPGRTIDGLIPHVGEGSKSPVSVGSGGSSSSNKSNAPLSTMVPPASRMESLREQPNEAEWTHISRDLTASPSSEGHVSQDHDRVSWESSSPPASVSHSQEGVTQTPSAKTRARTSLGAGLKRFASLPRTPSRSPSSRSRSLGRSGSTSTHNSTRSNGGSPAAQPAPLPPSSWNPNTTFPQSDLDPRQNQRQPMPRRRKIVSRNPPALSSADLVGKKSALERCSLYAQKINELYMHDCGLSEWMVEARFRGSSGPKAATLTQRTSGGGPQPRHVSHSSIKSEATFPIRGGGAMVATDLSTKPSDIAPAVPALPYPALSPRAMTMNLPSGSSTMPMPLRMLASAASSSSHSSNSSKSSGNLSFFSSLGRKASMSKPNKPVPMASFSISSSSSGGARLTKAPPVSMNNHAISNPRPVVIPNGATPAVPGGPRAPPNRGGDRALRTQSINISSPFSSNMADRDRSSASASMTAKRPSLFAPPSSSSAGSRSSESPSRSVGSGGRGSGGRGSGGRGSGTPDRDREFDRQVDKLSDLLPQAERDVLAGYLRRAGQDILAIGQYLEDEKNGVLRRD